MAWFKREKPPVEPAKEGDMAVDKIEATDWPARCEELVADARRSDQQMRLLRAERDAAVQQLAAANVQLEAAKHETMTHRSRAHGLARRIEEHEKRLRTLVSREIASAPEVDKAIEVTINGVATTLDAGPISYEDLVRHAGMDGRPSMMVSFGDRTRAGRAPHAGESVDLDDGAVVEIAHTGAA